MPFYGERMKQNYIKKKGYFSHENTSQLLSNFKRFSWVLIEVNFIIMRYDCFISLGRDHGCTAAFSSLLLSKFLYHVETVLSSNIDFLSSLTDRVIYFIQEYLFTNLQGTKSYQYLFFRHRNWKKVGDTQPPCCSERNFILASEDRKVIEPTFDFHKESWNFYKRFILMGL